jgi:hypothetical protein
MKTCPCCGAPLRESVGLRGINPNYWIETVYYCTSGYDCDLVGVPLYEDTLNNPAKLERLASVNRDIPFVKMVRRHYEHRRRA